MRAHQPFTTSLAPRRPAWRISLPSLHRLASPVAYVSAGLLAGLGLTGSGLLTDPWLTLFIAGSVGLALFCLGLNATPYLELVRVRRELRASHAREQAMREDVTDMAGVVQDALHERLAANCAGYRQAWAQDRALAGRN